MSFKDIQALFQNKRWEDLLQISSSSKNSIFSLIHTKEHQKKFFNEIPDDVLLKLIEIQPQSTLESMLKFYKPKYHEISLRLFQSNIYNKYSDELVSLLDQEHIIKIIESIIPTRFLEDEKNQSIFYRHAMTGQFSYKNLTSKIIRSNQNLKYCPNSWINSVCTNRKDLIPALKEFMVKILTYASEFDSNTVKPILQCAMNIYENVDNESRKELKSTLTNFEYPKVFKNTLCSSFIESNGRSEFNFYSKFGVSEASEHYLIPEIVKEINDSFDSKTTQMTLRTAALKMLTECKNNDFFQKRILMIKHYSHIEGHPLKNAWIYMISYLKDMIIKEVIQSGKSANLNSIISNLSFNFKVDRFPVFIEKVTLSYDESIDIIESTIKAFFNKKENICSVDPQRYTDFLLSVMSILVGTYSKDFTPSKYLYKSSDIFRSSLTFLSDEIRDNLIKECLFDPASPSSKPTLANWAQIGFHSDIVGLALRITNPDEICKLFPLNCKAHNNDAIEENIILNDQLEFDELGFSKTEVSYKFNDKLTIKAKFSFVELFMFQSKFWLSNSERIYSDAFAVLQKYLNSIQVIALSTKEQKRIQVAYEMNIRLIQLLMQRTTEAQNKFRFGFLSEVLTHPYSLVIGSIHKSSKEFTKEILELIENIPCMSTDPINLPFRVAINLSQNSYCKELPLLSETAEMITKGCLEYSLKSLDSLSNIEHDNMNSNNVDSLFDTSDSVCSVRNLFSNKDNNELIKKDRYKDFIRQMMNSIDSASANFVRISPNLNDTGSEYSINYSEGWTQQLIPVEAYKDAEEIMKTPEIKSGSGLKATISFVYKLLNGMQDKQKEAKEETPYFSSFKYQLINFLKNELDKIKTVFYSVEPLDKSVLHPSEDTFQYHDNLKKFIETDLILSPITAKLLSSLKGNKQYEEIIGESDLPIVFIESVSNNCNLRERNNKLFWKEVTKISQNLNEQQNEKTKNVRKERPYFVVRATNVIPRNNENILSAQAYRNKQRYINYILNKIGTFKQRLTLFKESFGEVKKYFGPDLQMIEDKKKSIESFFNGNEFNKDKLFEELDEKSQEFENMKKVEIPVEHQVEAINKQISFSLIQRIGDIEEGNWDTVDINSLQSFIGFIKAFSLYSIVHSKEAKTSFEKVQKLFSYILKRSIEQIELEKSTMIIKELSKYEIKFDLTVIIEALKSLFDYTQDYINNNIGKANSIASAQGIITIILRSIKDDLSNDTFKFDNNLGVKLLIDCLQSQFFSNSHFVFFKYEGDSSIVQNIDIMKREIQNYSIFMKNSS